MKLTFAALLVLVAFVTVQGFVRYPRHHGYGHGIYNMGYGLNRLSNGYGGLGGYGTVGGYGAVGGYGSLGGYGNTYGMYGGQGYGHGYGGSLGYGGVRPGYGFGRRMGGYYKY